jgi:hypothetical protein
MEGSAMKEIIKLRERAEIVGCRVRALRKPYHFNGKTVRYEFTDAIGALSASDLIELRRYIRRAEINFANLGTPNDIFARAVAR